MNHLWVVRHGATAWSVAGRHTGRTDIPLTDLGRAQAVAAGGRLAASLEPGGVRWALALTSPLVRARETATLAGVAGAEADPDLAEWDYGDYDGLTRAEILARAPGWSLWRDGCPNGESAAGVAARADRVIARCRQVDGPVVAFAHGHILRVLAARWLGQPPVLGASLALDTARIGVLGDEHGTPTLTGWGG